MSAPERWFLDSDGHVHVVDVEPAGFGRRAAWRVNGHEVARRRSSDKRLRLTACDGAPIAGSVTLRFGSIGPARRVTWHAGGDAAAAVIGLGGEDFTAEPGSTAARRDAWIEAHPRLFTLYRVALAALAVAAALAVGPLVSWLVAFVPWPDWRLPSIPWPDLPDLPWPDITLPDWSVPGWVGDVLETMTFVVPVVIAVVLARAEIRRRKRRGTRRPD